MNKIINGVQGMEILAKKLDKFSFINSSNKGDEKEAGTLAHAFMDLEESFRKFLDEMLPKLVNKELTEDEVKNLLWEIGDEFRHMFYHMKDPQIYRENYDDILEDD